jgi:4-amino-4-deoxy-L-arabinose transferase-like glycosyltransferase
MESSPNDARNARSSLGPRLGLALLLVAGLALRLVGLDHGLPHSTEPDGLVFATQTALIRSGAEHPERVREWGYYPQLVPRIAALLPAPEEAAPASLAGQLAAAARPWHDPRLVVALLSLLAVPGTFFLARRFLSSGWSLAAAALAGTSTLALWFAQQARPHAAAAALALLALIAALRVLESGRWIDVLLAGLAAALALGSLQFGLFVLPPILLAIVLAPGRGWGWRTAAALAVFGEVALGVLAFYPFLFARGEPAGALGLGGGELELSGHVIYSGLFNGRGFATLARTLADYEPWIGATALGGGVLLLAARLSGARLERGRARALLVVLAYALPFLLAIGLYQRTYQRFVIPLVPFLALVAAAGAARIALRGLRSRLGLALVLLAPQFALAARLATLRSRPDTVAEAARWIESQLQPGAQRVLFLPTHDLPLPLDAQALESNAAMMDTPARPWFRYQRALPPAARLAPGWKLLAMPLRPEAQKLLAQDAPRYLRTLAADWLVVEVYTEGRKPVVLDAIYPALGALAERVARFAPEDANEDDDLPLTWSDDEYPRHECWALRLLRAQRMGPVVEIWRAQR